MKYEEIHIIIAISQYIAYIYIGKPVPLFHIDSIEHRKLKLVRAAEIN
jgi:hypothetical protein